MTTPARYAFAKQCYEATKAVIDDEFFRRMFVAQAMIESGWGERYPVETCNPLGIKPVGNQPFVTRKRSEDGSEQPIRIFASLERCAWSWYWLVQNSEYYKTPRERLKAERARVRAILDEQFRQINITFAKEFIAIYEPKNPTYFGTWTAIRADLERNIWTKPAQ